MDEEQIAKFKLIELAEKLGRLETFLPIFRKILADIGRTTDRVGFSAAWKGINPMLNLCGISIRKSPERITSWENLEWLEVLKRAYFRSCNQVICMAPHCTECGECGSKLADGHTCEHKDIPDEYSN